jgi:molybdopterin/thiamine biosynthesis adenylyltransferase
MATGTFDYNRAFARNLGLVSEDEQARLKGTCVALAGLGGVGGAHLQALARMGIGAFHLADPDTFDVVNFNRQLGATMDTVGRSKTTVLSEMAHAINPEAKVEEYPDGISKSNIDAFLKGVDVVIDGIEFFCLEARRLLFSACRERGIPVITAGPIGYGAAVLVFTPESASFEDFFGISEGMTRGEQLTAFALGLAPGLVGDVDPSRVDVDAQKGPALAPACMLCAAAAAMEALKLICGRGRSALAPRGIYYDPYRGKTVRLRPRPSLTRTLRGRVLRWLAFKRFPALRAMHEREILARNPSTPAVETVEAN